MIGGFREKDDVRMSEPARKKATYDDLFNVPENMTGEIIDGELFVLPRPSRKHGYAVTVLGHEIGPPYHFGRGGPGGWIFIIEPEIRFGEDILVPDLAGWKKGRILAEEEHNWISTTPDWACEVLSPGTLRIDKIKKMPIYAQYGVSHLWLIDPLAKVLDVFRLESGRWSLLDTFLENDTVRAEPFAEIEIKLGVLWWE